MKREIIYLLLHCRHPKDSCIMMGSDERHFNVSLIVRDKVTRQCPQTTTFEEKGEQQRIQTNPTVSRSLARLGLFSRNGIDSRVVQAEFNCGILIG